MKNIENENDTTQKVGASACNTCIQSALTEHIHTFFLYYIESFENSYCNASFIIFHFSHTSLCFFELISSCNTVQ